MFEKIDELLKQFQCERNALYANRNIYAFENFTIIVYTSLKNRIEFEINKQWDLIDDFYQILLEVKKQTITKNNYDFIFNLFVALHAKGYVRFKS